MSPADKKIIEAGESAASLKIYEADKIWSCYSHDKVDIGEELYKVIRTLSRELPLTKPLRAFSIGSSNEPQFRILETAFRGGLYLLDLDKEALGVVVERIKRQCTDHVATICADYNKIFLNSKNTRLFLKNKLGGKKVNLVTLHHSLYYSRESDWRVIFNNLYREILAPKSALHAVLMASRSNNQYSTTWLYNHFAGKFRGCRNDQDLRRFGAELAANGLFRKSQILCATHCVKFFVDDFAKFMAVVWMILLYPDVHKYTFKQRKEISEFVYHHLWKKKKPLIQEQDHLVVYRGIRPKGLV